MTPTPTTRAVTFIQYQDNIMPFTHLDVGGPVAMLSLEEAREVDPRELQRKVPELGNPDDAP